MQPEQIVTSYELSKRLEKLGFPRDATYFIWYICGAGYPCCKPREGREHFVSIAAPTAEELIKHLPLEVNGKYQGLYAEHETTFSLTINGSATYAATVSDGDICGLTYWDTYLDNKIFGGNSLADTLAKMLIWLADNGYINFKEKEKENEK